MSGLLATLSRELRAYFFSPLAYVVLAFFLLVNGIAFSVVVSYLNDPNAGGQVSPLDYFFGGIFFWIVILSVTPLLTMRSISEELRSGTIESLMTAPVTEAQVVVGKYLAALCFYLFLWLPTVGYVLILDRSSKIDWGPVASGYFGTLGIGAVFLAAGILASSFTRNQIVAAVSSFAMVFFLFFLGFLEGLTTSEDWREVFNFVNLLQHMDEFGKGIVDTRRIVYYVSTVGLFLFLTSRSLASRKWR